MIFLDFQDFFMKTENIYFKTLIYFFKNTFGKVFTLLSPVFSTDPMIFIYIFKKIYFLLIMIIKIEAQYIIVYFITVSTGVI